MQGNTGLPGAPGVPGLPGTRGSSGPSGPDVSIWTKLKPVLSSRMNEYLIKRPSGFLFHQGDCLIMLVMLIA